MPQVVFMLPEGARTTVDARAGVSVMLAALRNGVDGIVAECGGNRSCATCHVWVDDAFAALVGPPDEDEDDLMEMAVTERRPSSRLSCQITMTEALDGLTVEIPSEQP